MKFEFFNTHKNFYMGPLCVTNIEYELYEQEICSFGTFFRQQAFFRQNRRLTPTDLIEHLNFLKTHKNSNTISLCITDLEYGGHDQEIRSFGLFLPQIDNFQKNRRLTPMDWSKNLIFLKTHKNSYMVSFCVTDLEYGRQSQEIWSFGQFLPQTGNFR
jgi:hypothetical protein